MNNVWTREKIEHLFALPVLELVFQAQTIHRKHFDPQEVELCTLLNIKTGACPENCSYCPQSGHYDTGLKKEKLMDVTDIIEKAKLAKANGATRFCMGAAWRQLPEKEVSNVVGIVKAIKALGLEACLTAGMLTKEQTLALAEVELDYYNHNLDTSPEYYENIITTHTYEDRLNTLELVRQAGIHVCCGGILGLGEAEKDRIGFLLQLASLTSPPDSIPINKLIRIKGTPLENNAELDHFDFIRTVAVARIMMPTSRIRLSAGRQEMSEEMQAMCFMAGANSIHFGEKLLVTANCDTDKDMQMLAKLGMKAKMQHEVVTC